MCRLSLIIYEVSITFSNLFATIVQKLWDDQIIIIMVRCVRYVQRVLFQYMVVLIKTSSHTRPDHRVRLRSIEGV